MRVLELKDIKKSYFSEGFLGNIHDRVDALRGITLSLEKGDILAVVGESGSGKTTLAKIICGLEKETSGYLSWKVSRPNPAQMVFQNPVYSLNPKLTVRYSLYEALACAGVPRSERARRSGELLSGAGLDNIDISKYPHQFSGGQRQRIAVCRALALNPEVLVCDEPVSALDISVQAQIINFISGINSATGLPVIFIAHDLEAVSMIATRIAVMKDGLIVEEGDAGKIIRDPADSYTRRLLEAVPVNPWR